MLLLLSVVYDVGCEMHVVESDVKELKKGNKNTQTAVDNFVKFSQVSNCKGVKRNAKNNLKCVERDLKNDIKQACRQGYQEEH